eukprot:CAMPEP_0175287994 /NCGR_PEP_ID=MMETSP0093-20121207/54578_1 /TAXON_ID=311494 /ORGANISM="Alexandrium monilatum, Strain CCMP3105" /LENGTH=75 /DNA_ID=CAMNT_0016583533 /DNA_START=1 /DNA_END=224 /DNA_ORIENTATION=-
MEPSSALHAALEPLLPATLLRAPPAVGADPQLPAARSLFVASRRRRRRAQMARRAAGRARVMAGQAFLPAIVPRR